MNISRSGLTRQAGLLVSCFIGLAVIVRFFRIGIDPPLYFSGIGQSLLTDPYNIVYFARNKVLFGAWDIFGYDRWIIYKYSLSSAFSYLFFLLGGVSRITANLSAIVLNLAGLVLFCLPFRKVSRKAFIIVLLLLLVNMMLLVYGRYPFLENGLILLSALLYFLFERYYPKRWMMVVSGLMVALCALSGKMFGLILIVPVGYVIFMDDRRRFLKRFGLVMISLAVSMVVLSILFYGNRLGAIRDYLTEQTVGMYGIPASLNSPIFFIMKLITFGVDSRLFFFAPFLLILLFCALLGLILVPSLSRRLASDIPLQFNLAWLVAGILFLMNFNYRPLRYELFLLMPMAGVISMVLPGLEKIEVCRKISPFRLILTFLLCWYFVVQLSSVIYLHVEKALLTSAIFWALMLPTIIVFAVVYFYRRGIVGALLRSPYLLPSLLLLYVSYQSILIYEWLDNGSTCLHEASEDLARVVGKEAVVCGPYAQALTIDNHLKSFVYMFGLSQKEPDLFYRFPITHLAADLSNWEKALEDYPWLRSSFKGASYWIRDVEISIIRINQYAVGRKETRYVPSNYEKAYEFYNNAEYGDSVYYFLTLFLNSYPRSKAGLILMANHQLSANNKGGGLKIYDKLISLYSDDFSLYYKKAMALYFLYRTSGNTGYLHDAERFFEMARSRNPYIGPDIAAGRRYADSLYP
jgi:hypothetical protein